MNKLPILFILLFSSSFAQNYFPISEGEIVSHSHYTLSYNEDYEQAEWVYYELTKPMVYGHTPRRNNFRTDPNVSSGTAQKQDYYKSGFDRGHLAPAGDMKISERSMSESFYFSNISPQYPSFNRGVWRELETLVRAWVSEEGDVHVVTAGVLSDINNYIGLNRVGVPSQFYKIIFSDIHHKMIGFVIPNRNIDGELDQYVVTVDYIENITGIDFFSQLDDKIESLLESNINIDEWDFNAKFKSYGEKSDKSLSKRCNGIAKSTGLQCKNSTINTNGYCHHHVNQSNDYLHSNSLEQNRCKALTKSNLRCKRKSADNSQFCWQH